MSEREREPLDRRDTEIADFEWRGIPCRAMVSRNSVREIVEVFIDPSTKSGTDVSIAAKDGAILASIALQLGATPGELIHSLQKSANGKPAGIVGAALAMFMEGAHGS